MFFHVKTKGERNGIREGNASAYKTVGCEYGRTLMVLPAATRLAAA